MDNGASIGVTVTNTSGGNYDNTAYNNILFTSSGIGTSQKWSGGTVKLSATDGYCYAYFPYSSSATSITAIPVTAGGTDYMYAERVTVNDKDKNATLNMKHALAAIRFALKKGTYAGTGAVSSVSVASAALGSSGTLNAKTGGVTAANLGTAVAQSASFNLETSAKNVDVVMVPSGNAGTITLSVTIDGKVYSTEVSSTKIEQGSCYTYTITVDAGSLALSGVKVGDWGYSDNGSPIITAGGYTVTIEGDYEDIYFSNKITESAVTIEAFSKAEDFCPSEVTISGTSTVTQFLNRRLRRITISEISSNIIVIFNGVEMYPWLSASDGVYYISASGSPTFVPDNSCIGVALVNTDQNQRLMIEKYENENNAESTTIYANAAQQFDSSYAPFIFSWGGYGNDYKGITNYTSANGSNFSGYLPNSSGSYSGSPYLPDTPSAWISGALSDFAGKSNSEIIKNITTNGTSTDTEAPIAYLMNAFNDDECPTSVNQGYLDWFVPSCGQLGLIWLNLTAINNALTAIGGTTFSADYYWSSSEHDTLTSWLVRFSNGYIECGDKRSTGRLRLVREL